LIVDGAMWGVLSLYVGHAGFFDSDEVNLLEEVAADIAFAIGVIAVRDRGKKLALLHEELESERSLLLKRLELQFDSMPVGCIVSDPALRVMQWNGAAERIFGYKEKEAVGRDMIEYIAHESIRQSLQRRVRQVLSERRPFVTIGEGITKSGTRVLCRWTVVPLRSDAGVDVGTMAMAEDVSDKFAMEQALERETGKLRRAQELARVGDWTWNLQTSHLSCSDELCAMVGVPQAKNGENLARAYLRNVRPEDVRRLLMANARAVSHGKVAPLQFRIIRPDGSERVLWVQSDAAMRRRQTKCFDSIRAMNRYTKLWQGIGFILTVGVVSNHGNWFTAQDHNKELRVLAHSYDWLLFLTDNGLCQFIEKLLLKPVPELQPARDAFLASYPKKLGGSRFTKVTMGVDADLALKRYFELHKPEVESWFNVIAPRGGTLRQLREDLLKLVAKDWKWIRQS